MSTLTAALKSASGAGPATHRMVHDNGQWRKGPAGFAERHCGHGHWIGSDWENDQLDTCHMFQRLEGVPAPKPKDWLRVDDTWNQESPDDDTF